MVLTPRVDSVDEITTLSPTRKNVSRRPITLFQLYSSPMRFLPTEVLSHILQLACATNPHPQNMALAMCASQVCRYWRAVALSTRVLWSTIVMTFPHTLAQATRVSVFLSRSKKSKLSLFLDFRDPKWDWNSTHPFDYRSMVLVMGLFLPHIARWRSVELLTDTWAPIYTFLSGCKGARSALALERIFLARCNAYYARNGQEFQPAELRSPIALFGELRLDALRELSLSGVHVDWSSKCLQGLKSLELSYLAEDVVPSPEQFIEILQQNPDLETLTILGCGPSFRDSTSSPMPMHEWLARQGSIRLDRLKSLTLGFNNVDDAVELLSLFKISNLEHLSLEDMDRTLFLKERPCDSAPVFDALCRAARLGHIRRLEVQGVAVSPSAAQRLFTAFTGLREFVASDCAEFVRLSIPYFTALSELHIRKCLGGDHTRLIFEAVPAHLKEIIVLDDKVNVCDEDLALLLVAGVVLLEHSWEA